MVGYIKPELLTKGVFNIEEFVPIETESGEPYTRLVQVEEGMKIYPYNNCEDECNRIIAMLKEYGIETKIGQNCESGTWSIYIKSVPDESN